MIDHELMMFRDKSSLLPSDIQSIKRTKGHHETQVMSCFPISFISFSFPGLISLIKPSISKMLTTKLATIAVLATVASAAPTTAAPTTTEAKPFKFSQWVDDIINPDVVALTPEQAVEAYFQSVNATASTPIGATKAKRFSVQCYTDDFIRAEVNAAAMCVSSLAALGNGVTYSWSGYAKSVTLCNDIPNVELQAVSGTDGPKVATA